MRYGKWNEDGTREMFYRVKDGICLGYGNNKSGSDCILICKTFISNDMIHEGQLDDFKSSSLEYKKYWDETYGLHDFGKIEHLGSNG